MLLKKKIILPKIYIKSVCVGTNATECTYLGIKVGEISETGGRCEAIDVIVIDHCLLSVKWIRVCICKWIRSGRRCWRSWRSSQRTGWTLTRSWRSWSWRWLFRFLWWKSRTRTFRTRRSMKIRERIIPEWILRVLKIKREKSLYYLFIP